MRRLVTAAAALVAVVGVLSVVAPDTASPTHPSVSIMHPAHSQPGALAFETAQSYVEHVQLAAFVSAAEQHDREIAAFDAFLSTLPPPAPPAPVETSYVPQPAASSGPHSDAWWHGVSVCEQGGRNDAYFGYFSIMDGSAGGLDWSTQVAMANGIISRYGDSAWAASCVAAGYAASPSG